MKSFFALLILVVLLTACQSDQYKFGGTIGIGGSSPTLLPSEVTQPATSTAETQPTAVETATAPPIPTTENTATTVLPTATTAMPTETSAPTALSVDATVTPMEVNATAVPNILIPGILIPEVKVECGAVLWTLTKVKEGDLHYAVTHRESNTQLGADVATTNIALRWQNDMNHLQGHLDYWDGNKHVAEVAYSAPIC